MTYLDTHSRVEHLAEKDTMRTKGVMPMLSLKDGDSTSTQTPLVLVDFLAKRAQVEAGAELVSGDPADTTVMAEGQAMIIRVATALDEVRRGIEGGLLLSSCPSLSWSNVNTDKEFKSVQEALQEPTPANATTLWKDVQQAPPDAILGIAQAFQKSKDPLKVNVCIGAYRDNQGKPWVLPSVRAAEHILLNANDTKEYLPIEGDADFVAKALRFAYGTDADIDMNLDDRVVGVQSLSGTGALRIGGRFLAKFLPGRSIYLPTPTWGNHYKIFAECHLNTKPYHYYDSATNRLDIEGMLEDFEQADDGSIILLHACAHNPTGCDLTPKQWEQITDVLELKNHIVFFDSAYQGFASGDAEKDAAALRYVVRRGLPVLLAQSFAKNFGLYGERCGTFSLVCGNTAQKETILSQLRCIIRPMYSSPPRHGSSIVKTVLSDDVLKAQYYQDCATMAARIQDMRSTLVVKLHEVGSTHDWSHVRQQIGMFAYTGMSHQMCDLMMDQYAIYLTRNGRISLAGLNDSNVEYVAKAMHAVTDGKSITTGVVI